MVSCLDGCMLILRSQRNIGGKKVNEKLILLSLCQECARVGHSSGQEGFYSQGLELPFGWGTAWKELPF